MKYETAGDPISGLLWTRKTREKISDEFAEIDIRVGATTVGNLLKKLNYSLKCNSKKVSNGGRKLTKEEEEMRDEQFKYIAKIRSEFVEKNLPVISVDGKKKERIGNFKNPGTRYKKESDLVNDHDFNNYAKGKVFPYGLFDELRYEGFVYVGQSLWDQKEKKLRQEKRLNPPRSLLLGIGRIMGSGDIEIAMRFSFWPTQAELMGIDPVCGSSSFMNSLPQNVGCTSQSAIIHQGQANGTQSNISFSARLARIGRVPRLGHLKPF
jgi:hypothetical protein